MCYKNCTRLIVILSFLSGLAYADDRDGQTTKKVIDKTELYEDLKLPENKLGLISVDLPPGAILPVRVSNSNEPWIVRGHWAFEYYPNNYDAVRQFWAYQDFECQPMGAPNYLLFVEQYRTQTGSPSWNYRPRNPIRGSHSESKCSRPIIPSHFCNGAGEKCINHFVRSACIVNRDYLAILRDAGVGPLLDSYDHEMRPPSLNDNNQITRQICSIGRKNKG